MRRLSLTAMMLLMSVPAVSADHYHPRHASHACILAQTTRAPRRQGHCAGLRPPENRELLSGPAHFRYWPRQDPPRAGDRRGRQRRHAPLTGPATVETSFAVVRSLPVAEATLRIPLPVQVPVQVPEQSAARSTAAASRPVRVPQAGGPAVAPPDRWSIRPYDALRRSAPFLVWSLIIALAYLLVRLVSRRPWFAASPPADAEIRLGECRNRCVAGLRLAGWDADSRRRTDRRDADVIARSGGRMLAVRCHPSTEPVDAGDVEHARQAREIQGSDLVAIVSNASFTEPARRLAARSGIVLLHEHQLASFAA